MYERQVFLFFSTAVDHGIPGKSIRADFCRAAVACENNRLILVAWKSYFTATEAACVSSLPSMDVRWLQVHRM
jgi:hypothetical protein